LTTDDAAGGVRAHRLVDARSTYLRSAAEQSIDWHPWGPEPFALARRTGRPILLDIGAVWCHWCHVMDEGTYADGEVARLLAQHFVAVKVDRDEHPEVDRRYQRQVGALTGEGGWPLTAFLTPDGEVFLGGTYFPAQDGLGRPGFRKVLREVARVYAQEPDRIAETTRHVQEALGRLAGRTTPPASRTDFRRAVAARLDDGYDAIHGGFGFAPKFPHPTAVAYLLYREHAEHDAASGTRALETLRHMADGGMYDQLGGGFHRYAVDEGWHVPHFEKMGTDNGALLAAYVEGARRFDDPRLVETVRGIVGWTLEVLSDPKGGFGASQDADNAPGDDGGYFTWSRAELKAVLDPDDLRFATRLFGVGTDGRMPHDPDRNVLFRLMSPAEASADAKLPDDGADRFARVVTTLRSTRAGRPSPVIDRALYADINGGFVRGFAMAGRLLGDSRILATARQAADRFLRAAFAPDRGVAHRLDGDDATGYGHLDDQAQFALGLLELAGATLDARYLTAATQLLGLIDKEFRGEDGLLRDLAPALYDGPRVGTLGSASYPLEDSPHLAANSAAALAFIRLGSLTGDPAWTGKAEQLVTAIAPRVAGSGLFACGAALASGLLDIDPARVVITGDGPAADALLRAAERAYHPNAWVFRGEPPAPFSSPDELAGTAGAERAPRALVCFGRRCLAPITDPAAIAPLLRSPPSTTG